MELAPVPPRILISAGVAIATAISGWLASKTAKPTTAAHSEFAPLDDLPAIIGQPVDPTGTSWRETLARRMSVANALFTISLISLSVTAWFTYQFMLEV